MAKRPKPLGLFAKAATKNSRKFRQARHRFEQANKAYREDKPLPPLFPSRKKRF